MIGPTTAGQGFLWENQRSSKESHHIADQLHIAHVVEKITIKQRFAVVAALQAEISQFLHQ